eukprot:scaffold131882_cov18-Tisochrysis_lutea.AAC.1
MGCCFSSRDSRTAHKSRRHHRHRGHRRSGVDLKHEHDLTSPFQNGAVNGAPVDGQGLFTRQSTGTQHTPSHNDAQVHGRRSLGVSQKGRFLEGSQLLQIHILHIWTRSATCATVQNCAGEDDDYLSCRDDFSVAEGGNLRAHNLCMLPVQASHVHMPISRNIRVYSLLPGD